MSNNDEESSTDEAIDTITGHHHRRIHPRTAITHFKSAVEKQFCSEINTEDNNNTSFQSYLHLRSLKKHILSRRSPSRASESKQTNPNSSPALTNSSTKMDDSLTLSSPSDDFSNLTRTVMNTTMPTYETIGSDLNFLVTYKNIMVLAKTMSDRFAQQKHGLCQRIERLLNQLLYSMELSTQLIHYISDNMHHYDYSAEVS